MKRIIALILVTVISIISLTSCDIISLVDMLKNGSLFDTDAMSETLEETEKKNPEETKYVSKHDNPKAPGAKFVGFKTAASEYDGEFNSTVGWMAAGMGYIIKTYNGKLIVIDGGAAEDSAAFYRLLKDYSLTSTVVVDYWILTHPHSDHVAAFVDIANNGVMNMEVKNIVFDFPTNFKDSSSAYFNQEVNSAAKSLGAKVITPKKGDKISLDGVELEFLYVPVNYSTYTSANYISLIFTVKTSKKSILITGDAFEPSLKSVANEYKSALKCDILQMPHHALCDTGYEAFYNYVGAETLLLPTCIAGYKTMTDPNSEYKNNAKWKLNKKVMENAKKLYFAYEGNFVIEI